MIIAIDTGGTKTLIASFSQKGELLKSIKFETPKQTKKYLEAVEKTIHENFNENFEKNEVKAISAAMPALMDGGTVAWAQHLHWKNFDVQSELQKIFPSVPVFIENDANLAGLSEARLLKNPAKTVLYITVSTGIGAGIITDNYINEGLKRSESGRIIIEYDGVMREWEQFASGKAIFNTYGKYTRDIYKPKTWLSISDKISRGLLVMIPIIQPNVIVIGGSVGSRFDRFGVFLTNIIKDRLPSNIPCPKIVGAQHPQEAVIYGCYEYAKDCLSK